MTTRFGRTNGSEQRRDTSLAQASSDMMAIQCRPARLLTARKQVHKKRRIRRSIMFSESIACVLRISIDALHG